MSKVVSAVAVVLAAAALAVAWTSRATVGPSPGRIAGQMVKDEAASAGVIIRGDKVWSVRRRGDFYTVIVRVQYQQVMDFLGSTFRSPIEWTTFFIHMVKSGGSYSVIP